MARPKDAPKNAPEAPENRPVAAAPVAAEAPPKPPLRLEWIEAGSLTENPLNWRRHSQEQLQSLRELLDDPQVGWAGACLYNERTGRLIDGHARREVVDPKTPVPVLVGSWTEEAEAKILATLDPVGAMATGDAAAYQALIARVQADGLWVRDLLHQTGSVAWAERCGIRCYLPAGHPCRSAWAAERCGECRNSRSGWKQAAPPAKGGKP